jgi:hypothetical protein
MKREHPFQSQAKQLLIEYIRSLGVKGAHREIADQLKKDYYPIIDCF